MLPDFDLIEWVILGLFSLLLPVSILFGRGSIRKRRLEALTHLQNKVMESAPKKRHILEPYFELVRARYDHSQVKPAPGSTGNPRSTWSYIKAFFPYLPPVLMFAALSATGLFLVLAAGKQTLGDTSHLFLLGFSTPGPSTASAAYQYGTILIVSAGFLGAYAWSINYLILRVANFDLTPLDFLRVTSHILLTILVVGVIRHVVAGSDVALITTVVLGIAFAIGMIPSLGLATLIDRLPSTLRLKRTDPKAAEISRELPLDMIDGIDAGIKFRLGNYEINDVQILATSNPISIYVATPYSFLEILDWIAQAQLLMALGPDRYLAARKMAIRDIVGLLDAGSTTEGRAMIGPLLFGKDVPDAVVAAVLKNIARPPYVELLCTLWHLSAEEPADVASRPELKEAA